MFPMVAIAGFAAMAGVAIYGINAVVKGAYSRGLTEARAECVAAQAKANVEAERRVSDAVTRHTEISRKAQATATAAERLAARMRAELAASRAAHKATLEGECVPGCRVELPE